MSSPARPLSRGQLITYPNREKRSSRLARGAVCTALVVSAGLMLLVTVEGWSKLAGLEPLNFIWALVYLVMAFYVLRWARELLPLAVALGALMFVFTLIVVTSAAGVTWSDRASPVYAPVHSLFGGAGLAPRALGALTVAITISQGLLMAAAITGFRQAWNIEQSA
jgi:hypothetical protein